MLTICDTKDCPKAAICLRKLEKSVGGAMGFEFTFTIELDQFSNRRFNCLNLALDAEFETHEL